MTVAFVPVVIVVGSQTAEIHGAELGFRAEEYLSFRLQRLSPDGLELAQSGPETGDAFEEIKRRLAAESGVSEVAMSSHVPGANHPLRRIQVEGNAAPEGVPRRHRVAMGWVDSDFFDALHVPMVAGRGFRASDLDPDQHVVIVNEDFVRFVLGDRSPLGQRFAYVDPRRIPEDGEEPTWFEVIGVVSQVAMQVDPDLESGAGVYHPLLAGGADVTMAVRVGPDPTSFSQRLHEVVSAVDPTVMISQVRTMDEGAQDTALAYETWLWVIMIAAGVGLILTLAGIYSIMAFIVSRRTREIGVRVALGAGSARVLATIFARALSQLVLGVGLGGVLFAALVFLMSAGSFRPTPRELALAAAYLTAMMGVLLLACVVPTRRALAIEPTEALNSEG